MDHAIRTSSAPSWKPVGILEGPASEHKVRVSGRTIAIFDSDRDIQVGDTLMLRRQPRASVEVVVMDVKTSEARKNVYNVELDRDVNGVFDELVWGHRA